MFGMALANPAGLQLDFLLRVFGLRLLAGLFLLIAIYGFFTLKLYRKQTRSQAQHVHDTDRLSKQMVIQKMMHANDTEFVQLLVAYLEKFTTHTVAHSLTSLLAGAKFSDNEIAELKVVNYGKGKLSSDLRKKILQQLK